MSRASKRALARISWAERGAIAVVAVGLCAFFPYFEEIHSANELSRVYLTNAIVEEGTFAIDGPLQRLGNIHDKAFREGHHYSDKAPGVSFWSVPVAWVYHRVADEPSLRGEVRVLRLWVSTLPTLVLLFALAILLRQYVGDQRLRAILLLGYGLGSLATTYGVLLFGHQLSGVLVFGCFLLVRGAQRSLGRSLAIGFLASAAVAVEYQNVIFLLPLAVWFLWQTRLRPGPLGMALLGALPLAVLVAVYHHYAFGSAFKTGYSFLTSNFAEVHAQGVMGISTPTLDHLGLSTVSPSKGLFYYAPWLVLALPGMLWLVRAGRTGLVSALMIVLYLGFVSAMVYPVGGWTVSQRHLTPLVPWLVLPVGLLVARITHLRSLLSGLVAASVVITGISTIVWPHYQEQLLNPFFQVGWPLFEAGYLPPSVFNAIGLSSYTGAWLLAAVIAAGLLADLALRPGRGWLRVAYPAVAIGVCFAYLRLTAPLHADQDVRRDIAWIKSVYEPDPLRAPEPSRRR